MGISPPQRSPRGLRSFLFAPGNHARKVEKVFAAGADAVILDLEDAVPVADKERTRELVVAALQRPRSSLGYVRINGVGTRWCMGDLESTIGPWLDGVVVPKVESPDQLRLISEKISDAERRFGVPGGSIDLMPIVETALGIESARDIAAAGPRVRRMAFGGGDYTTELDIIWTAEEHELAYARARLTHGSRIAGLEPPIDTVCLQVKDHERFRQSALNGRRAGFAGKLCIHPDQVAACNEVYSPAPQEIERARQIVAAFEAAEATGSASIRVDGEFVDYPIVERARRVLALAARINTPD